MLAKQYAKQAKTAKMLFFSRERLLLFFSCTALLLVFALQRA